MEANQPSKIGELFNGEATANFDSLIVKLIPGYQQMITALIDAVPFESNAALNVIDLGSGTGTVTELFLTAFPNSRMTLLDFAPKMMEQAKVKLSGYPNCRYLLSDFNSMEFDERYDVIFSSLALHHLVTDADKKEFYRRILSALNPGGFFINFDPVLPSSERHVPIFAKRWNSFMNRTLTAEESESRWHKTRGDDDFPATLTDHLRWMAEVGFIDIDVIRKDFSFAVWCGFKG